MRFITEAASDLAGGVVFLYHPAPPTADTLRRTRIQGRRLVALNAVPDEIRLGNGTGDLVAHALITGIWDARGGTIGRSLARLESPDLCSRLTEVTSPDGKIPVRHDPRLDPPCYRTTPDAFTGIAWLNHRRYDAVLGCPNRYAGSVLACLEECLGDGQRRLLLVSAEVIVLARAFWVEGKTLGELTADWWPVDPEGVALTRTDDRITGRLFNRDWCEP